MELISIKDLLPEINTDVLILTDQGEYGVHRMILKKYDNYEIKRLNLDVKEGIEWDLGCCCGETYGDVTHWMPLPRIKHPEID